MQTFRIFTGTEVRFKPERDNSDPFPPSYYEVEKNAKAKLAQMMRPPKRTKRNRKHPS